jgi:class 3 adenylate cyclase/tetratricopeptide (TPR) repeat protein
VRCAHCQSENREGRKFCASCGAALSRTCEICGYANEASDLFCGGCGRPIADGQSAAAESPIVGGGDRRPVAVVFCDIVGYMRLSSKMDPEDVHSLLERFFAIVDAAVDRYGGVIDKHIGDAAMALFGAPRAHGDDALRAIRAALEIQTSVPNLLMTEQGALEVHLGVAMGEVVASGVGSDRHRGYSVTGEAANVAARLLDRAQAGETLVSEEIYVATSHAAEFEPLGKQNLKGLDGPILAWRLTGLKRATAGGSLFVGRRSELAQCRAALTAIIEGSTGAVIVVRGEPGIGKTRFIEEVQSLGSGLGFSGHAGFVLDFGTERGHGAIRTIVASLLGLTREALPQEVDEAIAAAARDGGPVNDDDALYLRDLLEVPQRKEDRPLYEAIDPAARAQRKARVLGRLIEQRSLTSPLLVTIEDVHWADAGTLAQLGAIARATKETRAALVMTTRIESDPLDSGWRAMAAESVQVTLQLAPLASAEAQAIALRYPAAVTLAAKCVERAGGNPLFLEQLLRTAGDLVDGRLPNSIQSVILARRDLLAPNDRRAIEAASVLGQRFALANLRALIDDSGFTGDTLLRNALLRPVPDGLQFAHALVRDGIYASLTRARRRQLHKSAARVFLDDPLLRAEHLDLAEDPDAPLAYLAASKDQSALFRQDQSVALASRGLAIAARPWDRIELALQLGDLQLESGGGQDALDAYGDALRSAGQDFESSQRRALIGCAAANRLLARFDDAFAALDRAERLSPATLDDRALAEIHYLRGNLHFARGELEECREEHAAALATADRLGSPQWRARALSGLADALYMECRMAAALRHFSQCVETCDANGLTRIAVPNRVMMGVCRVYICEFDAGLDDMRTALEIARRIGDRHAQMLALESIGFCLSAAGRYDSIAETQSEALELARTLKARRYEALLLAYSAELALVEGRRDESMSLVRQGLTAAEETNVSFAGPILYGLLALLEREVKAQEAAIAMGESLLAKGAIGHNHFWFRRFAIDWALRNHRWDEVDSQADALVARTAVEPLAYSNLIARRGHLLARRGRGQATLEDDHELKRLRTQAAEIDLRLDAIGEAIGSV